MPKGEVGSLIIPYSTFSAVCYGDCRNSPFNLATDRLFTGQRLDGAGLYYYGARYYDPEIGRFISPDTIIPNVANPQAFNRCSYVTNNPLKYTDPSGCYGVSGEGEINDENDPNDPLYPSNPRPVAYPPGFDSNGHAIPGYPTHSSGDPDLDVIIDAIFTNRLPGITNSGITRVTNLSHKHLMKYGPMINQLDEVRLWFVEDDSNLGNFLHWRNAGAMAIGENDVLISESLAKNEARLINTIPEELYHCSQAKNGGGGFFQFFRYMYYDLTVGYGLNPYEGQAKSFAASIAKNDPWSYKDELKYLIRK